ncbi:MAG: hypothetical protein R6U21_07865, partial [Thermoplasmatota archaeon]
NTPTHHIQTTDDFDPLVDIQLTIDIQAIRAIDTIDDTGKADFYLKIIINENEFISPTWQNTDYLYHPWSVSTDIPDNNQHVSITIQLWNHQDNDPDFLCDLSPQSDTQQVHLNYNIATGHWTGDDHLGDTSGYGRLNGCDDGSMYTHDFDAELWFDIYQNDYDGDKIPYWAEVNDLGTDPTVDDTYLDPDGDEIPTVWEWKWGYDPHTWDDHHNLDPDNDSINNYEEYLTRDFLSDPFRKDIFLEIDFMEDGPNGENNTMPDESIEIIKKPYHRRNIMFHIDTEQAGGEIVPFDNYTVQEEILNIYQNYFLHNGEHAWKRGVYHYGIFVYHCKPNGFAFSGSEGVFWGYGPGTNSFIIESQTMERIAERLNKPLPYIYAASVVHEMGHNFGIRFGHPFGCDNRHSTKPWFPSFWIFLSYKSIMNYFYTYDIMDYSDGTNGIFDFDDWSAIDLTYFEPRYECT